MTEDRLTQGAVFLLRVALGVMFTAHSLLLKLVVFTLPGTAKFFETVGLPGWLAYAVFAVEAVGGLCLVFGVRTRWVALGLVPVLAGATWVHLPNGWMFANPNGGWEYPLYLTVLAVAQFMLGGGAFALAPSKPLEGAASPQMAGG